MTRAVTWSSLTIHGIALVVYTIIIVITINTRDDEVN